jgi:hypothetical protein
MDASPSKAFASVEILTGCQGGVDRRKPINPFRWQNVNDVRPLELHMLSKASGAGYRSGLCNLEW